jgi:hypothetical protein
VPCWQQVRNKRHTNANNSVTFFMIFDYWLNIGCSNKISCRTANFHL